MKPLAFTVNALADTTGSCRKISMNLKNIIDGITNIIHRPKCEMRYIDSVDILSITKLVKEFQVLLWNRKARCRVQKISKVYTI